MKLLCGKCKSWLGITSVYKKEYRRCYLLFVDVIKKKARKDGKNQ